MPIVSVTIPTSLPPSGAAGGDLSGTFPSPTVAKVNGVTIATSPPLVVPLGAPLSGVSSGGQSANQTWGMRVVIPFTGTLHDVGVYVTVQSGNVALAVYDTGQTTVAVLTRLATSGSLSCGAADAWQTFDPALAVTAGQQLMLALAADNVTAEFTQLVANHASAFWTLATGALATPAAAGRLTLRAAGFVPPATIADGALSAAQAAPLIIARIS